MVANPVTRVRFLPGVPVPHLPRRHGRADRAADRPGGRAAGDPPPDRTQDRPAGARLRPADASGQERHAHHGRRADPAGHRHLDPAVVRPVQPLRLDRAAGHAGLRRHRLGGRLAQGGEQGSGRHALAREVLLAVGDRPDRRLLPGVQHLGQQQPDRVRAVHDLGAFGFQRRAAGQGRAAAALFQAGQLPAGCVRFCHPDLSGHRGRQQCRQSDRRPGRPGHHAGGHGGFGAGRVRLRCRQRGLFQVPVFPAHPRLGRGADFLRGHGRRRPGLPLVQHPSGPGFHG